MHHLSKGSSAALRRAAVRAPKAQAVIARGAHKEIRFSNEGRASILNGVDILAKAVSVTLGPKGECRDFITPENVDEQCRSECDHRAVVRWA